MKIWVFVLLFLCICFVLAAPARAQWARGQGPLSTRWGREVSPEKVHPEYPRPQMVRKAWLNLNGLWEYAVAPKDAPPPAKYEGKILVPFPVESLLSGVGRRVDEKSCLWCRRTFEVPPSLGKSGTGRYLLHFGAVDWEAEVHLNGKSIGVHRGGYDAFTFEITHALNRTGSQELVVRVWDPTDKGGQPRGKQVSKPGGIWYTPTTGIWQTVWLEPVPAAYISKLKMTPHIGKGTLSLAVEGEGIRGGCRIKASAFEGEEEKGSAVEAPGRVLRLRIENPKLWSPQSPFLYNLEVRLLGEEGEELDRVESYFGMREISLGRDKEGSTRLFLNNEPLFMLGLLDQGFWPDGLYTAPADKALRFDIEATIELGFNLARKHVKIEPERWYFWCDKLGLLVWQDMPSGNNGSSGEKKQFEAELQRLIEGMYNHPSIVMWILFNEGWGQYDTERLTKWAEELDPSRLVSNASGWHDKGVGNVMDIHAYPGPAAPKPEEERASVLGEFGGLGLKVEGHAWELEKSWGYKDFQSAEALTGEYENLVRRLRWLIASQNLSAAVYTQTTDVEIEVNGMMTYDRAQIKMDPRRVASANKLLYLPPPEIRVVVPSSEREGQVWRYTTSPPPGSWFQESFDDSSWDAGAGGFGREGTPGSIVRTPWHTQEIWLRRTFAIPEGTEFRALHLVIHHDEDAEVLCNGVLIAKVSGYTVSYIHEPLDAQAVHSIRPGKNTLAVHCRQTGGGQYIDVGLVDVIDK